MHSFKSLIIRGLCLINQLRQENLICSQEVKDFYHIGSSKNKDSNPHL